MKTHTIQRRADTAPGADINPAECMQKGADLQGIDGINFNHGIPCSNITLIADDG